jgi:hypothetical protein
LKCHLGNWAFSSLEYRLHHRQYKSYFQTK